MKRLTLILFSFLALAGTAAALSIDTTNKYAWGENIGWLNWGSTEGAVVVPNDVGELTGYVWGENVGWISLNCSNTASCGTVDYKVSKNVTNDILGYAWGENVGWLSFNCLNTASCGTVSYGVTFDPATGEFEGYAWGENVGWVNMNCSNDSSCGTVDFKVMTGETPTPTPGGGTSGYYLSPSPTPTPSVSTSPGITPTTTPVASPLPSAFPTPTTQPPTVTPTSSPRVIPPTVDIIDRISDGLDRFSSTVFGRLCEGPLGIAACTTTAMSAALVVVALAAALIQSEWLAAMFSLFQIIGLRRRTKVWGVVYDSRTKRPIPLAKLELLDEGNRVLETRYADRDGRYGFLTSPASLHEEVLRVHIRASKPGFAFPSAMISTGTDYIVYENVYKGGVIELRGDSLINHNIPMDPTMERRLSWSGFGQGLAGPLVDRLLSFGFYIGLIAVPLNWWFAPTTKNLVIGIVFVVANAIRMLALYRPYGMTRDALTGRTMPYALVVLNDLSGNRQGFAVSDEHGRFILSGQRDKDYEVIAYTPANIAPQRSITRRVRGLKRFSTQAWITENLTI